MNFLKSVFSIDWLRPFSTAYNRLTRHQRTRGASAAAGFMLCLVVSGPAMAGPEGGVIRAGDGTITERGLLTLIRQNSDRLAIDWESFNVGANETVRFIQPGDTSVALNRIFDQNPSQIFGVIEANGRVILINPNGMLFGETAQLNVAGLVASTLSISVDDFMSGNYTLEGTGEGGLILNQGTINSDYVALIGEAVANEGLIVADAGVVHLAAGRKVAIDFDGGGLMFFESDSEILSSALDVDAAVSNSGTIIADGGRVLLTADAARDVYSQAINNSGLIQARRIDNTGGVIRLSGGAGDTINSGTLDASGDADSDGGSIHVLGQNVGVIGDAVIDASGGRNGGEILIGGAFQGGDGSIQNADRTYVGSDARINADAGTVGDGGSVIVWADDITRFFGTITARGGMDGGNGGFAEVSGANTLNFRGMVNLSAPWGGTGTLLLDPAILRILGGDGGGGGDLDGNILPPGPTPQILFGDSNGDDAVTAAALESQNADILLQATDQIIIEDQNLNGGDGSIDLASDVSLTMETRNGATDGAGGILFVDPSNSIIASGSGSISLTAGTAGDVAANLVNIGNLSTDSGAIALSAADNIGTSGSITSNSGSITLTAGGSITIGAGSTIDSGSGDLNLAVDDDGDSAETLAILGNVATTGTSSLTGSGSDDTLESGDGSNTWNISAANAGTLNSLSFSGFGNLTGGAGADQFILNAGGSAASIEGGAGNDTLVGGPGSNTFNVNAQNAGSLNGTTFTGVENLSGGAGADTFTFTAALDGTASGGGGDDTFAINDGGSAGAIDGGAGNDEVTYAGSAGPVTVAIDGFANIETLTGSGSAGDTLQGTNGANAFTVDAANSGTADGINFSGFENLDGLGGDDSFTLNAALTGAIDGGADNDTITVNAGGNAASIEGGAGNDTLVGGPGSNTFNVNAQNAGNLNGSNFEGIENLTGGAGADTFTFTAALDGTASGGGGDDTFAINDGGSAGAIDGGADSDEVTYAGSTGPVTVGIGTFADIETLTGSGNANDVLQGTNGANAFTVDGANSGTADGINYSGFENINGLGGNDTFTLNPGGSVSTIDGGGGFDTIIGLSAASNAFVVTAVGAGTANGISFVTIDNLTGGAAADTFTFNASLPGIARGGGGDDTFTVNAGGRAGLIDGGAGVDEIVGNDGGNTFVVNAADAGMVNGDDFIGVENLTGGAGNDTFTLNGALSGNLIGGAGDDIFNIGSGGSAAVIDGGIGNDEIDGGDGGNFFVVTAADAGSANGTNFSGIENLTGGAGADTFTLNAALSGSVVGDGGNDIFDVTGGGTAANYDGGAGADTLIGSAGSNTFNVTAANAGDLNGVAFANMENLIGGAGADTFNFDAALGGTASGGAGDDTFNVNDGGSAFFFSGGTGNDLLSFAGRSSGATINTSESGTIENIVGSAFDDIINLSGDQSNGLSIDGGAGTDSFAVTADSTLGGDLTVTNVESAAIDAVVTANDVTLNVNGAITRNGGGIIGQVLTTTSAGGQDIQAAVDTFNATNVGGGDILFAGAGGLTVSGVSQSGGGDVDIASDGNIGQTGNISSDGGDISLTAIDGSLTMSAGTITTSNGGDIDYATTGTGGDITIGTLRTCVSVDCAIGDTGQVSITTVLGSILAQSGQVNVTADTAVLNAQGDIGTPDDRFVFDGMVIDVPRITLTFTGSAYVDTRGILFESNQVVDDLSDGGLEAAARALAVALDEDRREDEDEATDEGNVYEIDEEGVRAPSVEGSDGDMARINGDSAESAIPLSQLITH